MLRVYDEFLEDETITALSHQAYRLHMSALIYSSRNLTDGVVSPKGMRVLFAILGFKLSRFALELVDAGVWMPLEDGGFRIRNYLEFNPDAETVKGERAKARERMRKMREKRAKDRTDDVPTNVTANETPNVTEHVTVQRQSSPVLPFRSSKAVTADEEKIREVQRLMRHLNNVDVGSEGVLLNLASKLPLSSIAKVRESCQSRKVGAGYAVRALQSELADLEERQEVSL